MEQSCSRDPSSCRVGVVPSDGPQFRPGIHFGTAPAEPHGTSQENCVTPSGSTVLLNKRYIFADKLARTSGGRQIQAVGCVRLEPNYRPTVSSQPRGRGATARIFQVLFVLERSSGYVHERTLLRISNALTQNFMRHRRNIPFAQK